MMLGLLFGLPASGQAGPYQFTNIADNGVPVFTGFGRATTINSGGTVAFRANLPGGFLGIFTGNGQMFTTIHTTMDSPLGITGFGLGGPTINSKGTVAFRAILQAGDEGIFTGNGGPLTTIITSNVFDLSDPVINEVGTVAWRARDGFFDGIFTGFAPPVGPPNVARVAGNGDLPPGGLSGFSPIVSIRPSIPEVAFEAEFAAGGDAIFAGAVFPEGTTPLVDTLTILPLTPVPMRPSDFFAPFINDRRTVAFLAEFPGGLAGVFTRSATLEIALIADTSGPFSSFGRTSVAINFNGTVAFEATLAGGGEGIFTGPNPIADMVIATGDPLFGSTVTDLSFRRGLNDAGQLSFFAQLADGREVIVRANPIPEPGTFILFATGILGLIGYTWRRRSRARSKSVAA